MKNRRRRRSMTVHITLWFTIMLALIVVLTFQIFRFVSASILTKTIREYLLSSVEENCDKIQYLVSLEDADPNDFDDFYIRFEEGWLEVDDDFLDEINDVQSALYTENGRMLYGKNPIAKDMQDIKFSDSRIYEFSDSSGIRYYVYDRKVRGENLEGLWIRGIVPLSTEERQLNDIFRSAMIFVPVLMFVGIAGSFFSIRRALSPIIRIQQVASEITRGTDLKRRIEIGDVDREIYELSFSFNSMLDRLEHSFEAEQQFTSDASHELRTPTSVIMAQAEFALERERSPEEYRSALKVITRQGRRMNALIGSMLDYTRLELRPENYPLERLDFSELTEMTADDMSMLGFNNIEVEADVEQDIYVNGNRLLLERVVQNLIDNAYKYGKENGHINVQLKRCEVADDNPSEEFHFAPHQEHMIQVAVLSVKDDGIGISDEDQARIFERFFRGDPSRNASKAFGAGLGLAMVKKIVEIHGGRIEVSSKVGEGTVFTVHFRIV